MTVKLVKDALADRFCNMTKEEIEILTHVQKSVLFYEKEVKTIRLYIKFDIAMVVYNSAEACESVSGLSVMVAEQLF